MKKLDKFILKSYLGPLLLTFSIAMFVLMLQFLWQKMESLIGKGLETFVLLKMIAYASATLVPMSLPLAILLASIMTMGNFSERYELAAMKSSGISLWRILRPLIILSVIMSALAFFFSNNIMPKADEELRLMIYEIKAKKPAINIKPNEFYSEIDNYVLRIADRDKQTNEMKDVLIYDHSKGNGNNSVIRANTGSMYTTDNGNTLVFELHDGESFSEDVNGENYFHRPLTRVEFKTQLIRFDISNFSLQAADSERYKDYYKIMNISRLSRAIDSLEIDFVEQKQKNTNNYFKDLNRKLIWADAYKESQSIVLHTGDFYKDYSKLNINDKRDIDYFAQVQCGNFRTNYEVHSYNEKIDEEYINRHKIEYHKKFTLSLACVILFFIGAPLGAIIKKGGFGMPIVVSIIAFIIYYALGQIGSMLARSGTLSPFVGMWLSSFVFLPIGLFLTIKATSDAKLFDKEIWKKRIKNLFQNKKITNNKTTKEL
ncbi:MAG: LptF/LptG family permease [Bacteroidales bacterium]|nr:LptF/LptG family permease [Bacteroidales bacterium]